VKEFLYDSFEKEFIARSRKLKKEKQHDCPEAKISNAVCRLEKFWNRLSWLIKDKKLIMVQHFLK
jgi:hypothetical protein